jgi:hypothetical protein
MQDAKANFNLLYQAEYRIPYTVKDETDLEIDPAGIWDLLCSNFYENLRN